MGVVCISGEFTFSVMVDDEGRGVELTCGLGSGAVARRVVRFVGTLSTMVEDGMGWKDMKHNEGSRYGGTAWDGAMRWKDEKYDKAGRTYWGYRHGS